MHLIPFVLPGTFLAILFAFAERRFELNGVSIDRTCFSLNALLSLVFITVIFTLAYVFASLSLGWMQADDLPSLTYATVLMFMVLPRPLKWLLAKLMPFKNKTN